MSQEIQWLKKIKEKYFQCIQEEDCRKEYIGSVLRVANEKSRDSQSVEKGTLEFLRLYSASSEQPIARATLTAVLRDKHNLSGNTSGLWPWLQGYGGIAVIERTKDITGRVYFCIHKDFYDSMRKVIL